MNSACRDVLLGSSNGQGVAVLPTPSHHQREKTRGRSRRFINPQLFDGKSPAIFLANIRSFLRQRRTCVLLSTGFLVCKVRFAAAQYHRWQLVNHYHHTVPTIISHSQPWLTLLINHLFTIINHLYPLPGEPPATLVTQPPLTPRMRKDATAVAAYGSAVSVCRRLQLWQRALQLFGVLNAAVDPVTWRREAWD